MNPRASIHSCRVLLQQRATSHDGEDLHVDDYVLHSWEAIGTSDKSASFLWQGIEAVHREQLRTLAVDSLGSRPAEEDSLHLSAALRLPSPANRGLCTYNGGEQDLVSTTRHYLVVETDFSVYGVGENGTPLEDGGEKVRKARWTKPIHPADCSLTTDLLNIPRYTSVATQNRLQYTDLLSPYPRGTNSSFFDTS